MQWIITTSHFAVSVSRVLSVSRSEIKKKVSNCMHDSSVNLYSHYLSSRSDGPTNTISIKLWAASHHLTSLDLLLQKSIGNAGLGLFVLVPLWSDCYTYLGLQSIQLHNFSGEVEAKREDSKKFWNYIDCLLSTRRIHYSTKEYATLSELQRQTSIDKCVLF